MREKLKREIYKRGESLDGFADRIGISHNTMHNVVTNRYKKVRGTTIYLIAKGLEITYEETEELLNASS